MSSLWTVRRSAADSKLAGVCGGLARYWGVDPVLIRVGFAVLALCGGLGLVLYLAGWMLIPVDGKTQAPLHDVLGEQARRWPREVWIVIVAACCIVTFALLSPITPFGFSPAIVLALIWYFGYYRHRSPNRVRPGGSLPPGDADRQSYGATPPQFFSYPGPPTPFTEAATAWRQRVEEAQRIVAAQRDLSEKRAMDEQRAMRAQQTAQPATYRDYDDVAGYSVPSAAREDLREPVGPADSLPPARPLGDESVDYNAFLATPDPAGLYTERSPVAAPLPARPVKRSATRSARRLRLAALVVVGLTLSGLGAADAMGTRVPLALYFAATLLILGLTLVVATWWGRARGILPIALLVALATISITAVGPVAADQHWGTEQLRYTTPAQLAPGDSQGVGQLRVDLTGLVADVNTSYTAHVGLGDLEVLAPKNVNLVINWRVKSGVLILDGQQRKGGSNQVDQVKPASPDPKKKTVTLNLSVDRGFVQVTR